MTKATASNFLEASLKATKTSTNSYQNGTKYSIFQLTHFSFRGLSAQLRAPYFRFNHRFNDINPEAFLIDLFNSPVIRQSLDFVRMIKVNSKLT